MEEIFSPSDPADAALVAVELLSGEVIIKEVALQARPGPEASLALRAVRCNGLPQVAQSTHHFFDLLSVQVMPLRRILQDKPHHAGSHAFFLKCVTCNSGAAPAKKAGARF